MSPQLTKMLPCFLPSSLLPFPQQNKNLTQAEEHKAEDNGLCRMASFCGQSLPVSLGQAWLGNPACAEFRFEGFPLEKALAILRIAITGRER